MVALASFSWASMSWLDVGIALATLAAAALTDAPTPDAVPEVAGLKVSRRISPRFLLSDGRDSGRETDPTGCSVEPRWGVTASGEGDGSRDSRWEAAPLVLGVAIESSAGRKTTLIFFSWMEDLAVCSMWDHCSDVSTDQRAEETTYKGCNVSELLVRRDQYRLNEELVAALCVWRRVFLHRLEEDCVIRQRLSRLSSWTGFASYSALPHGRRARFYQSLASRNIYDTYISEVGAAEGGAARTAWER